MGECARTISPSLTDQRAPLTHAVTQADSLTFVGFPDKIVSSVHGRPCYVTGYSQRGMLLATQTSLRFITEQTCDTLFFPPPPSPAPPNCVEYDQNHVRPLDEMVWQSAFPGKSMMNTEQAIGDTRGRPKEHKRVRLNARICDYHGAGITHYGVVPEVFLKRGGP